LYLVNLASLTWFFAINKMNNFVIQRSTKNLAYVR
jgi:hypothetical protein